MTENKYPQKIYEIRKLTRVNLLDLLAEVPLTSKEIKSIIKKKFPNQCDDNIKCTCKGGSNAIEWEHQVAWAIQDVKYSKKIERIEEEKYAILKQE